jgi:hypothetical protein
MHQLGVITKEKGVRHPGHLEFHISLGSKDICNKKVQALPSGTELENKQISGKQFGQ